MKQLWNEGRVVGYSAYELYVKQLLNKDPNATPATEKEWLNSMMGSGASLLLRVGTDTISGTHSVEIPLPDTSKLCGASTIVGSFFIGAGDESGKSDSTTFWASKVTDYGPLIINNSKSSPTTLIPPIMGNTIGELTDIQQEQLKEYMKIIDGIAIIEGSWSNNANTPPSKDLSPDLTKTAKIRIAFRDKIEKPFYVLLTGFMNKLVMAGISDTSGSCNTDSPQNGDFLGVANYPWASKIIFSVPSSYMVYYGSGGSFARKLPLTDTVVSVNSEPIIDMMQSKPNDYYSTTDSGAGIAIEITSFSTLKTDGAILYTYSSNNLLPPSLYGSVVSSTGPSNIYPIDIASPNTIKLMHGIEYTYGLAVETRFKNYAIMRNSEYYTLHQIDQDQVISGQGEDKCVIPVADVAIEPMNQYIVVGEALLPYFFVPTLNASIEGDFGDATLLKVGVPTRYSGKLSNKIRTVCGFELTDQVFKTGGIYESATKYYIDSLYKALYGSSATWETKTNRLAENYYAILFHSYPVYAANNNISIVPVLKSDNSFAIIGKNETNIFTNGGHQLNQHLRCKLRSTTAHESGDISTGSSMYIGSYWDTYSTSPDGGEHPQLGSKFDTATTQIYMENGLLPATINGEPYTAYYNSTKLSDVWDKAELALTGILEKYWDYSLADFCRMAFYTDFGNGNELSPSSRSRSQSYYVLSNSKDVSKVTGVLNLSINKNASNSGMLQYISIPEQYQDESKDTDIQIASIQTGRKKVNTISLSNAKGVPYSIYGSDGSIETDIITWDNMLQALATNQKIDILGPTLRTLRNSMQSFHIEARAPISGKKCYSSITIDIVAFNLDSKRPQIQGLQMATAYVNLNPMSDTSKLTVGQHFNISGFWSDAKLVKDSESSEDKYVETIPEMFKNLSPIIGISDTLSIELPQIMVRSTTGAPMYSGTINTLIHISKKQSDGIVMFISCGGLNPTSTLSVGTIPTDTYYSASLHGSNSMLNWDNYIDRSGFEWSFDASKNIVLEDL